MQNFFFTAIVCFCSLGVLAAPTIIDFSTVDEYYGSDSLVSRIGIVSFSHNLYNNPDGFQDSEGGVYNWYGEKREYLTFAQGVKLISLDVKQLTTGPSVPTSMVFEMYNAGNQLLGTKAFAINSQLQVVTFNTYSVSKLVFDFTGGGTSPYGDARTHGWYLIDNIVFDATAVPVPEASTLLCVLLGAFFFLRRALF